MDRAEPSAKDIWQSVRKILAENEQDDEPSGPERAGLSFYSQRFLGIVLLVVMGVFVVAMFWGMWGAPDSDSLTMLLVMFAIVGAVGISLIIPRGPSQPAESDKRQG